MMIILLATIKVKVWMLKVTKTFGATERYIVGI